MPPFCGFSYSGEAHLLLFMTSYRNGSEDEPNNYGVSNNNHEVSCPASKLCIANRRRGARSSLEAIKTNTPANAPRQIRISVFIFTHAQCDETSPARCQ